MKWSAHVESWPAIRPFRITGKVWNTFDSIVVELAEGGAYGRGEALGVEDSRRSLLSGGGGGVS